MLKNHVKLEHKLTKHTYKTYTCVFLLSDCIMCYWRSNGKNERCMDDTYLTFRLPQ